MANEELKKLKFSDKVKTRDGRNAVIISNSELGITFIIEGEHVLQFMSYGQKIERTVDIVSKC